MMKLLYFFVAFLISYFFVFTSLAASQQNSHKFLQCLPHHSNISSPISNAIYYPDSTAFTYVLQAYIRNERFNKSTTPKPLLIVAAEDESHVQATVICAKANGLQIRIRSGGHDYEGLSYRSSEPFVLLDLFNLRSVDIDIAKGTAWAQAGATLGELYYSIANVSNTHAFPSGVCPTIGLGGHISGGGYGNLIRKYGISADHVIDAKVVNANGEILDRKTMGEDLFWAIRGGGAASFCVVLAYKINLVQVPQIVTVFNVGRTLEEGATDIVDQWQTVAPKMDNNLFIRVQTRVVNGTKEGTKTVRVAFIAMYLGRAQQLLDLVNKSSPLLALQSTDCKEMPWVKSTQYWFGAPPGNPTEDLLNRIPREKYFAKFRSDYVREPIPKAGLEAIWKKLIELENLYFQFNPYGGRMSEVPEDATPFPHRAGVLFKIQYNAIWVEDDEKVDNRHITASKELYDTFAPYVSKNPREHFLNYRDIDIGTNAKCSADFAVGYFKGNLPRLLVTKAQVDPDNFFRYEQSLPVISLLI